MVHGRMQATLEGGAVIVRGPGVRGLLAAGTSSGDMLLLDPASGFKVRSSCHGVQVVGPHADSGDCTIPRMVCGSADLEPLIRWSQMGSALNAGQNQT